MNGLRLRECVCAKLRFRCHHSYNDDDIRIIIDTGINTISSRICFNYYNQHMFLTALGFVHNGTLTLRENRWIGKLLFSELIQICYIAYEENTRISAVVKVFFPFVGHIQTSHFSKCSIDFQRILGFLIIFVAAFSSSSHFKIVKWNYGSHRPRLWFNDGGPPIIIH